MQFVVRAVNLYSIGHSERVRVMMQHFTNIIVLFTLRWKLDSLQYVTSEPAATEAFQLQHGGERLWPGKLSTVEVLGAILSSDGDTLPSVWHQLGKATGSALHIQPGPQWRNL
eukprot:6554386-Pyramimonas_sp.AAC.1